MMLRSAKALFGAVLSLGVAGAASQGFAADMPVKAPPLAPYMPLDVHGFVDFTVASTRVTGGGMLLYGRGALSQISSGVSLDLYKNQGGFINGVSVYGGVWNEFWSDPPVGGRAWQEMDWWMGVAIKLAQRWTFKAETVNFNFPGGATTYNYSFNLGLDDTGLTPLPFALNPYVNVFWNAAGASNVITGKTGLSRVDLGIAPSFDMSKTWNVPLTLTIPLWFSLAPTDYYDRRDGTTNLCGSGTTSPCATSSFGYFATGLKAKWSLASVIPPRLGNWYISGTALYYHLNNDALLANQTRTLLNVNPTFPSAERDIGVFQAGIGFTF
jgi:hypothetical protein